MGVRRSVVVGVVGALVLVGCGSRSPDAASSGPSPDGGAPSSSAASGPATGFGTLANPCGPADPGAPNGASAPGVTADEIVVTTIADPGGPKPGLNQGVLDSMAAFATWCNGFGGINGRRLVVQERDAKVFEYQQRVIEACADSFALVGGLGVTDQLGVRASEDCGLVNVPAATVSAEQAVATNMVQPIPAPVQEYAVGSARWIAQRFPDAPSKAALVYSQVPTVKYQADRRIDGYTQAGYQFVVDDAANVGETNWGPLVLRLRDQGVRYFTLTSSFEEIVPFQKEMAAQGFAPEVTELETNFYNVKFPQLAREQGAPLDDVYIRLSTWPFEEADQRPAMAEYLRVLEAGVPGAQPEQLGVQAFSAGLLFATAAKAAGPDLTRERLLEELRAIHEWDAGGLHGSADPGAGTGSPCFVMMQVSYDGFARVYPLPDADREVYEAGQGMACPDDAVVTLTRDFGPGSAG